VVVEFNKGGSRRECRLKENAVKKKGYTREPERDLGPVGGSKRADHAGRDSGHESQGGCES